MMAMDGDMLIRSNAGTPSDSSCNSDQTNEATIMKKYILLLIAGVFGVQSCNDDFLERYPETEISNANFFNSAQDLETYLFSLYDFPGFDIYINDNTTDNAATTGATELKNMMLGSPSAANITGGWNWAQLRRVNYFLDNFSKAKIDESLLNHYEGIARFFRAKFYMNMVKRYSDV